MKNLLYIYHFYSSVFAHVLRYHPTTKPEANFPKLLANQRALEQKPGRMLAAVLATLLTNCRQ